MIQAASGYQSSAKRNVDKAVDDLMSMHPRSSGVCYLLKVETTASDCFWPGAAVADIRCKRPMTIEGGLT
jgi:hypothetical protein